MQVRAEATRRLILDAAVELFDKVGYANSSLAELIAATGLSKGAFYYHFPNREAVTAALIAETDDTLQVAARAILADPDHRALGNLIRAIFAIADLTTTNRLVRVGVELRGGLSQLSSNLEGYTVHRNLFVSVIEAAIADGDIAPDHSAERVGDTLWVAVLGTHQHTGGTGEDIIARLRDVHEVLLPAICTPAAAQEYGELVRRLARERTRVKA